MAGYSTTDTLGSLIDETVMSLQGFGVVSDQVCSLVGNVSDSATSLTLDSGEVLSRGIIEVDQELMFVTQCVNGVATVPSWGRGWKGTAKASHTDGSAVYISPTFPRSIVSRQVNNTIKAVYPNLFAVKSFDFQMSALLWQYEMPADMDRLISVEWKYNDIMGWNPLRSWELVHSANVTDFASGKFLCLNEFLPPAVSIHVTYAGLPTALANETDPLSATGLPASCRDVIVYGAAASLLPWLDSGRAPVDTVSSDAQDTQKPIGAASSVAAQLRQLYNTRLQQERTALLAKFPVPVHKVR